MTTCCPWTREAGTVKRKLPSWSAIVPTPRDLIWIVALASGLPVWSVTLPVMTVACCACSGTVVPTASPAAMKTASAAPSRLRTRLDR